jgi:hypothetical protein
MRRIPEIHFVTTDADPACAQAAGQVAADRRGEHRDDNQIKAGPNFEGRRRNTGAAPGRYDGQAQTDAKGQNNKRQRA